MLIGFAAGYFAVTHTLLTQTAPLAWLGWRWCSV
jgi:hypothetical protein